MITADMVEVEARAAFKPMPKIEHWMTANGVVREFPVTRFVFEKYRVIPWIDGYECLDELAWRRGIEVDDLIAELRQAIALRVAY